MKGSAAPGGMAAFFFRSRVSGPSPFLKPSLAFPEMPTPATTRFSAAPASPPEKPYVISARVGTVLPNEVAPMFYSRDPRHSSTAPRSIEPETDAMMAFHPKPSL